uniref:Armadillo repeat containing 10 n=1 Tax=Propithecus coquereli TaxID=379532 RepID=A0A2K6FG29_PROCO
MGGAREVGWVAAGLVLGAGACYCIYRLTRGRRRGGSRLKLCSSRSAGEAGRQSGQFCLHSAGPLERRGTLESPWSRISQLVYLTNGSYDEVLNAEQLQKLLYLLESTEDPVIIERALVTVGNNAAFSVNQLLNLSEPQFLIYTIYINQVCEDVFSGPLNSAVQLAGLRLLTNMTVTNDHQHMLQSYITDLFQVLLTGNGNTKVQVLKLLLNLSENPAMTEGLLSAQVDSSFLSLYDGHVAKEILLRVLTLFQNINNCLKMEGRLAVQPTFTNGSLFFLLYGEECAQKIRVLVHHHDAEVKEKVVTIIPTI